MSCIRTRRENSGGLTAECFHDAVCSSAVDLAFVLDSSGSINDVDSDTWNLMRSFVDVVVRQFHISSTTAHVGVMQYSNRAEIILRLNYTRFNYCRPATC